MAMITFTDKIYYKHLRKKPKITTIEATINPEDYQEFFRGLDLKDEVVVEFSFVDLPARVNRDKKGRRLASFLRQVLENDNYCDHCGGFKEFDPYNFQMLLWDWLVVWSIGYKRLRRKMVAITAKLKGEN